MVVSGDVPAAEAVPVKKVPDFREEGAPIPKKLEEGIQVRDLSFAYQEGEEVLHHVNAQFQAGKSYALVGASGSGKSTLLNLLMAGHSGYSGEILYDGRELSTVSTQSLYELVSLVEQNVFVFNSTLRDNITMFRDFPSQQVQRAEELSGLAPIIQEKGEAYLCGENGSAAAHLHCPGHAEGRAGGAAGRGHRFPG